MIPDKLDDEVPHLVELNIGHSIVSRALMAGMGTAVKEMLALMHNYDGRKSRAGDDPGHRH